MGNGMLFTLVDDRLGGMLLRLRDDAAWEGIELGLWAPTVTTFAFELARPTWTARRG
jgi:hypothetical protein